MRFKLLLVTIFIQLNVSSAQAVNSCRDIFGPHHIQVQVEDIQASSWSPDRYSGQLLELTVGGRQST